MIGLLVTTLSFPTNHSLRQLAIDRDTYEVKVDSLSLDMGNTLDLDTSQWRWLEEMEVSGNSHR